MVFLCSVEFCFSPFFFVSVFISCSFDLVCFFVVISNWEALGYFSDWQQISLKSPTMRLTKVRHGRLNRQNRNKMGEDRQRKLTADHQQFNNWIKQIISFLTSRFFFCTCFYFVFFCFVSFLAVIGNWEAFSWFRRPTANIIKNAYNAID